MHSLPVFLDLRGRRVLLLGDGTGAAPKRRLLKAAGAKIVTDETADSQIAVLAIDDIDEAAAAASRLRTRGMLVNAIDKPDLCDFSFPAIVDRDPVIIAIGTGGASATLAKTLRERFEALLPGRLGEIAEAVKTMRSAVNAQIFGTGARRRFWDELMAPGAALDPLGDPPIEPRKSIRQTLTGGAEATSGPYELHCPTGEPDDLTLRDLRALSRADLILVEAGAPSGLVERGRRDAEIRNWSPADAIPSGVNLVILRA